MRITRRNKNNRNINITNTDTRNRNKNNRRNKYTYTYHNKINDRTINAIKNTNRIRKNNLRQERVMSMMTLHINNDFDLQSILDNIKKNLNNEAKIHDSIVTNTVGYIGTIRNIGETNIITNSLTGTIILPKNKNRVFGNFNLGNVNPQTETYFLKRGTGAALLRHVIDDLRRNSNITTLILHANHPNLEKFYERFGFEVFPEPVIMLELDGLFYYYGYDTDGKTLSKQSGRMMYLHL